MKLHFKIILFVFILLAWSSEPVRAQKITLEEADALFKRYQYALALPAYQKLLSEQQPPLYLTQQIAECYRLLNKAKEAEIWYNKVIQLPDAPPVALKYAADAARENGNYEQAKQQYLQYSERVPEQVTVATQLAAACDSAQQWLAQPEPYELQKPKSLNSENSDFSPVITQNIRNKIKRFSIRGDGRVSHGIGTGVIELKRLRFAPGLPLFLGNKNLKAIHVTVFGFFKLYPAKWVAITFFRRTFELINAVKKLTHPVKNLFRW